jgi:hypothetical protein
MYSAAPVLFICFIVPFLAIPSQYEYDLQSLFLQHQGFSITNTFVDQETPNDGSFSHGK